MRNEKQLEGGLPPPTEEELEREKWDFYDLKDLTLPQRKTLSQLLRNGHFYDTAFWEHIDGKLFPYTEEAGVPRGKGKGEGGGKPEGPKIDPERLQVLRSFEDGGARDVLFGMTFEGGRSFEGYVCVVFPDYILLEHPEEPNAAFVRAIPPLDLEGLHIDLSKPPAERVNEPTRLRIIEMLRKGGYLPIDRTKRGFAREADVDRIVHNGEWFDRMIDKMASASKIAGEIRKEIGTLIRKKAA